MNLAARLVALITLSAVLAGCQIPAAWIVTGAGAMPAERRVPKHYDVPPQIVYAIDAHRYFTLESYGQCFHEGFVYYNDTEAGIRTELDNSDLTGFAGKLHHSGGKDGIIAYPDSIQPDFYHCPEKGCSLRLMYSTDGGRTFERDFHPRKLDLDRRDAYERTKGITITATERGLYLTEGGETYFYDLSSPSNRNSTPSGAYVDAAPEVRTPSGDDRFHCDDTVRPRAPAK